MTIESRLAEKTPKKTAFIFDLNESEEGLIDPITDWIYLNRLWTNPWKSRLFYEAYSEFAKPILEQTKGTFQNALVLIPEGLSSSFGIMPFAFKLAEECELPVAVWKEFGNELRATPLFFPEPEFLPSPANLIILTDVVGNGQILRKINRYLDPKQYTISIFLSAIQLIDKQLKLDESIRFAEESSKNTNIFFRAMLTDVDLRRKIEEKTPA